MRKPRPIRNWPQGKFITTKRKGQENQGCHSTAMILSVGIVSLLMVGPVTFSEISCDQKSPPRVSCQYHYPSDETVPYRYLSFALFSPSIFFFFSRYGGTVLIGLGM